MRLSSVLSTLALLSAASTSTAQQNLRFLPCNGGYQFHSSGAVATAQGLSVPVGTAQAMAADITMGQCGRELVVTIQGMPVVLNQDVMNERSYSGAINMGDGVARTLSVTVGTDRNLRGELVANDANLTVKRPVWLMLQSPTETRFENCTDDTEEPFAARGLSPEAAAVSQKLAALGLTPAEGLGYGDYLTTVGGQLDDARVQIRLSPENEILPHPEIAFSQLDDASAHCTGSEYVVPTYRYLGIQVNYTDNDVLAFARITDASTSQITAQQEGAPTAGQGTPLETAISDAWNNLGPEVGQMTNGVETSN